MGLEGIMLNEISQIGKDKYMISLICGICKNQIDRNRIDWLLPEIDCIR